MKREMTFDELDKEIEFVRSLPLKAGSWSPTLSEIESIITSDMEEYASFILWILETGKNIDPEVRRYLMTLFNDYITIKEDDC